MVMAAALDGTILVAGLPVSALLGFFIAVIILLTIAENRFQI